VAYDKGLAQRVRESLEDVPGISERKMFGGLAFLLNGNMACGVIGEDLMVRVGPEAYARSLPKPHVRAMDFTGRPMKGLVYVSPPGFEADKDLDLWVGKGVAFARSLPAK
jgi:TfoX/Sxy family transcriptional regulator of competence genes